MTDSTHHQRAGRLPEAVKLAEAALERAKLAYRAALLEAFPIGSGVISYARRHPIAGAIVGIGDGYELGYVSIKNDATGKCHKACVKGVFCDAERA